VLVDRVAVMGEFDRDWRAVRTCHLCHDRRS
jgi:hypothetical protein